MSLSRRVMNRHALASVIAGEAGRPALITLFCKDEFDNVASQTGMISFGLRLLPRETKEDITMIESMKLETVFLNEGYEIRYMAQEAGVHTHAVYMRTFIRSPAPSEHAEPKIGAPSN